MDADDVDQGRVKQIRDALGLGDSEDTDGNEEDEPIESEQDSADDTVDLEAIRTELGGSPDAQDDQAHTSSEDVQPSQKTSHDVTTEAVQEPETEEVVDPDAEDESPRAYFNRMEEHVADLREEMEAAADGLDMVQLRSTERRTRQLLDEVENILPEYRDRVERLTDELDDVQKRVEAARREHESKQEAIDAKDEELARLEEDIQDARQSRREQQRELTKIERERERFLDEFEREKKAKQDELDHLDQEVESKRDELDTLESTIRQKEHEEKETLTRLQRKIDDARDEYEAVLEESNDIMSSLRAKEEEFLDAKRQLQEQIDEHKRVLRALRSADAEKSAVDERRETREAKERILESIQRCRSLLHDGKANQAVQLYNDLRDSYHEEIDSQEALDEVYSELVDTYKLLAGELDD